MAQKHEFTFQQVKKLLNATLHKTVGEIDSSHVVERAGKKRNKGIVGDVIEQSVFGYPPDSLQEPDLLVDGVDVELKVTGLRRTNKGTLKAKEPMSVTAVSVDKIASQEFASSALWHKLENLLLVFYLYNTEKQPKEMRAQDYAEFKIEGWTLHVWSEDDRKVIEHDWTIVRDYVRMVEETVSDVDERKRWWPDISTKLNPEMLYLGTAPKYPNPPRFRLKNSVVTMLWELAKGKRLEQLPEAISSYAELDSICSGLDKKYHGQTVAQIAADLGYDGALKSKSVIESLVVRMFGGTRKKMSQVEVFCAAGVHCKSVILKKNGFPTEDMKLIRIDFEEVPLQWEDTSVYSFFSEGTLLCPIFQEPYVPEKDKTVPIKDCIFLGFKRLSIADGPLVADAEETWNRIALLVIEDELRETPRKRKDGSIIKTKTGVVSTSINFPKARDYVIFVRGSGSNARGKTETVNGIRMYKQNLWIRKQWVDQELAKHEYL